MALNKTIITKFCKKEKELAFSSFLTNGLLFTYVKRIIYFNFCIILIKLVKLYFFLQTNNTKTITLSLVKSIIKNVLGLKI